MSKPVIDKPVIVEGKYDKAKVSSLFDCYVFTTDGFGIFKNAKKAEMLKMLALKKGVIILTDSDGAGLVIRNHIKGIVPADKIINLYIPQVKGKEKRKSAVSKEGFLGVEGIDSKTLYDLLLPFSSDGEEKNEKEKITKGDFYRLGLAGGPDSQKAREELAEELGLPRNLSANAIIEAINTLGLQKEFKDKYEKDKRTD